MRAKLALAAELGGPVLLVVLLGVLSRGLSPSLQGDAINILVTTTIVVALYIFIGNSGVMSFGQISFVAVGAFAAGILTTPVATRRPTMPGLFGFLADTQLSNIESLLLAAALGGIFAFVSGLALMRLNGLGAGIATFAVLEITYNVLGFWGKIGPATTTLALVPVTTGLLQGTIGCVAAIVIAFAYQHTRSCRQLRATREDLSAARGIGISVLRHRVLAFTLSGTVAGFAGALFVHELGSINVSQVYLDLTFATLALLVIGGVGSLWGATVGGTILGIIDAVLSNAETGISVGPLHVTLPNGSSTVIFGALMVAVLILAPKGITRGREFLQLTITRPGRRRRYGAAPAGEPDGQEDKTASRSKAAGA
ncbi:MAG: branched-chain amino acid ABC transporter permease [Pseudonocardiales bacterium]|nr:branched-chain amino acid ABC transporter permease [Pseudonocardiales bacterium]